MITTFRGLAGDAVYRSICPSHFKTLAPVALMFFFGGLVAMLLFTFTGWIPGTAFLVLLFAFTAGRFSLPIAHGNLNAGFMSGERKPLETVVFSLKYLFLSVLVALPIRFLSDLIVKSVEPAFNPGKLTMHFLIERGVITPLASVLLLVALLAPVLSLIVLTASSSLEESLSPKPWIWTLVNRFPDFIFLYSSYFGALVLTALLYLPPLLFIQYGISRISMDGADLVVKAGLLLYFSNAPIILGRLAGAFVYGTNLKEGDKQASIRAVQQILRGLTQACEPIERLSSPPPERLVDWARRRLRAEPGVERAYLFLMTLSEAPHELTIGLELSPDYKHREQQKLISDLTLELSENNTGGQYAKLAIVDGEILERAVLHGTKIFERNHIGIVEQHGG